MRGQYIPLSRAICCRPCLPPDVASLPGVVGNVTADAVVALATDCQSSTRGDPRGPSRGPSCPADAFLQGFEAGARANPTAPVEDRYFYPTGPAQCCSPRLLLRSGEALRVERCECGVAEEPFGVSCGSANTLEAASAAGALVHAFDNEMAAMSTFGNAVEVPVTPLRCCKMCLSPNAKPATEDCAALGFCGGHGRCAVDGHCECDEGWEGDACAVASKYGYGLSRAALSALKVVGGFFFGCFVGIPAAWCLGLLPRRRRGLDADELEEELLARRRENEWDFEASDLSTSDESDADEETGRDETDDEAADRAERGEPEREDGDGDGDGEDGTGRGADTDASADAGADAGADASADADADADADAGDPQDADAEAKASPLDDGGESGRGADAECTVCMSAPVQVVLIPCGHACLCRKCARRMRRCPVCRVEVQRRQKLYLLSGA